MILLLAAVIALTPSFGVPAPLSLTLAAVGAVAAIAIVWQRLRSRRHALMRERTTQCLLTRNIADNCGRGVVQLTLDGKPVWANAAWEELTGAPADSSQLDALRRQLARDDADRVASLWQRCRVTKERAAVEICWAGRRHGSERQLRLSIDPLLNDHRCEGFLLFIEDRTDRRRDAEALETSEDLYRLVTENSRDIIIRMSLDGVPLYVSKASQRVLDLAPEEMVGTSMREFVHPEDWSLFARIFSDNLIGDDAPELRYRQRRANGKYLWVEASFRPVFDSKSGMARELVATLRDIHRRHLTEQIVYDSATKLRETNRLLVLAEELAQVAHWRLDLGDGSLDHGGEFNRILGLLPGKGVKLRAALRLLVPGDRKRLFAATREAIARSGSVDCAVDIRIDPDERRHLRIAIQGDRARSGALNGIFGVVRDVTEQYEANAELVQARDRAQQAARTKSNFLATMSHEIRTPMTGVLGMIDLMRDSEDTTRQQHYLETLKRSADHLMTVLDDILDFSKIEAGHLVFEQRDFRLERLVNETVDLFASAVRSKGLQLDIERDIGDARPVQGDPARLRQVLSNLLSNAVKFTPSGKIVVRVEAGSQIDHQQWRISVRDSGIGIAPDALDQLFQPFTQADASTSRRFGGTGLGLSITQALVEGMGGKLHVSSEKGVGSTFTVELDLPDGIEPEQQAEKTHAKGIEQPTPRRVLVAEDNPVNQMLVRAVLAGAGHAVETVGDGRAAVRLANESRFDVIVMDMQMPELDGLAATREIRRAEGDNQDVPIIALTADASPERRRFYEGAGLTAFLTKPIDQALLIATIEELTASPLDMQAKDKAVDTQTKRLAADDTQGCFDKERLDELGAALGAARLGDMLGLLKVELELRPELLATALDHDDVDELHDLAHSLKGAASSAGAIAVAKIAAQLERSDDPVALRALLDDLDLAVERTLEALVDQVPALDGDNQTASVAGGAA
ncbi:PAS domain-containing hybrid sensor histidine kinase/response regulator [Sphingomicrobium sediminis]|uniref:histidine kinase n=1 Tax=Sphingomicrobium sediminis TaxID=2950949 RepID=A0A9X2J4A1_9SPHN|nr:ATP-binding protein [Sphingomicrobium sediminis]MCM8558146.1 ATP-binding protein [Sphingomicrobium sediminis]